MSEPNRMLELLEKHPKITLGESVELILNLEAQFARVIAERDREHEGKLLAEHERTEYRVERDKAKAEA